MDFDGDDDDDDDDADADDQFLFKGLPEVKRIETGNRLRRRPIIPQPSSVSRK